MVAITRGCPEVVTIDEDDLAAREWRGDEADPPPKVATHIAHELELPSAVELTYFDPARAYTNNTQRAIRYSRSGHVQDTAGIQAPIVMSAKGARRSAERLLYGTWLEAARQQFALGPKYLEIIAGSPVLLPVEGDLQRVRVVGLDMGLPGEIRFSAVLDGDWILTQDAEGDDTVSGPAAFVEDPESPGPSLDFRYPPNSMYLGSV